MCPTAREKMLPIHILVVVDETNDGLKLDVTSLLVLACFKYKTMNEKDQTACSECNLCRRRALIDQMTLTSKLSISSSSAERL